jgi:hypothetical protein
MNILFTLKNYTAAFPDQNIIIDYEAQLKLYSKDIKQVDKIINQAVTNKFNISDINSTTINYNITYNNYISTSNSENINIYNKKDEISVNDTSFSSDS